MQYMIIKDCKGQVKHVPGYVINKLQHILYVIVELEQKEVALYLLCLGS